jgi:hypothetical protein
MPAGIFGATGVQADVAAPGATPSAGALGVQGEVGGYPFNTTTGSGFVQATSGSITTATTTLVLAGVSGESTYVRFAGEIATGSQSGAYAYWEYGTGSTCGTGTTVLWTFNTIALSVGNAVGAVTAHWTGALTQGINSSIVPAASDFVVPAGNSICIVTSGTTIAMRAYLVEWQHY